MVGAVNKTINGHADQGAAYVFTESGGTWSQQAELLASHGTANAYFGDSVALSGTTAMVGAPGKSVANNAGQGAAYFFSSSAKLAYALKVPTAMASHPQLTRQYILSNSSTTASAAAAVYWPVPGAASYTTPPPAREAAPTTALR